MKFRAFSYAVLAWIFVFGASGCASLPSEWVAQDRDNFGRLDQSGLDRWIADDTKLTQDEKDSLRIMNVMRRGRIARACVEAGIPATPTVVPHAEVP